MTAEDNELYAVGDEGFQDVVAIGEELADRVVGFEQGFVAGFATDNREFASPDEFSVVGIDFETLWGRYHARLRFRVDVSPILSRAEAESGADEFVADWIVVA